MLYRRTLSVFRPQGILLFCEYWPAEGIPQKPISWCVARNNTSNLLIKVSTLSHRQSVLPISTANQYRQSVPPISTANQYRQSVPPISTANQYRQSVPPISTANQYTNVHTARKRYPHCSLSTLQATYTVGRDALLHGAENTYRTM